jgi:hypothetical protein
MRRLVEFEQELLRAPRNAQALAYRGDIEQKTSHLDRALVHLMPSKIKTDAELRITYLDLGGV